VSSAVLSNVNLLSARYSPGSFFPAECTFAMYVGRIAPFNPRGVALTDERIYEAQRERKREREKGRKEGQEGDRR